MACYAYSVLTRWFSSMYSGAGSRPVLDQMVKHWRGGVQEVGEWEGGPVHTTTPATALTPVLGPLGPVPSRGDGSDGGGSDDDARPLGSPSSSPTRETVRRRAPLNCGEKSHPPWAAGGVCLRGGVGLASPYRRRAEDLEGLRGGAAASGSDGERRVLDSRRLLWWVMVMLWIRLG